VLLSVYLLLNLAYSRWLKHIPLIDVLVLASFYLLRIQAGVELVIVERFSPWLYIVSTLLALYIGFGKRRAELASLNGATPSSRPVLDGYTLAFLDQLLNILTATTLIAYSLYTFSAPNLPANHVMMLTIPFVLYGLFRYLYLVQVRQMGGAPEEIAFRDRPLQLTLFLWGLSVIGLLYGF